MDASPDDHCALMSSNPRRNHSTKRRSHGCRPDVQDHQRFFLLFLQYQSDLVMGAVSQVQSKTRTSIEVSFQFFDHGNQKPDQ